MARYRCAPAHASIFFAVPDDGSDLTSARATLTAFLAAQDRERLLEQRDRRRGRVGLGLARAQSPDRAGRQRVLGPDDARGRGARALVQRPLV
jgi:hypothetical protein